MYLKLNIVLTNVYFARNAELPLSAHPHGHMATHQVSKGGLQTGNWAANRNSCVNVNWHAGINILKESFTYKTFSITEWGQSDNNYSTYPSSCQPAKWDVTHTHATRERERGRLGEDTHSESLEKPTHTHTHRGEDTTERTACQTTWHHGQHNKHTHTHRHTKALEMHSSIHNWVLMQETTFCSHKTCSNKHRRGDAPGGSGWHQQQSCLQMGHAAGRHCDISEKDGFGLTSMVLQA